MKKNYCEFCGQELFHGRCDCNGLEKLKNSGIKPSRRQKKKCLYCKNTMYFDSNFCPACGMPNDNQNVINKELQKELTGENGEVINITKEEINKRREMVERELNRSLKTKFLLLIIIVLLSLILIFQYLIPFFKDMAMSFKFHHANMYDELNEKESDVEKLVESTIENITEDNEDNEENEKNDIKKAEKVKNIKKPQATSSDDDNEDEETIKEGKVAEEETKETEKLVASRYKNEWVKRDGDFYAFDDNGDPLVDEWVLEVDKKTGESKYYYFNMEGKLATNTWVNNEYYVGADGKMYRDTYTPDGVKVDKDGKAILETSKNPKETYIIYDSPDEEANVIDVKDINITPTQQVAASQNPGVIKGTIDTSADLYFDSLKSYKSTYTKNGQKASIKYYYPVVKGKDSTEVTAINNKYKTFFANDFLKLITSYIDNYSDTVLDITLYEVELITLNKTRFNITLKGKLTKASGRTVTLQYRVRYNRDSQVINGEKMDK